MEKDKIIAVFNAYDISEVETITHASGYSCALWDLQEKIRSFTKYGHEFKNTEEALDSIYQLIFDLRSQYHLPAD